MTQSVFARFEQVCRSNAQAVALESAEHRLTYAQLHDRVASIGARLAAAGVTPGTLLGIFLPRDVRLPAALLASLGSGAVYVPLTEKYPPERLREIIETHGIEHVVTTEALASQLPASCGKIVLPAEGSRRPARGLPASAPTGGPRASGRGTRPSTSCSRPARRARRRAC